MTQNEYRAARLLVNCVVEEDVEILARDIEEAMELLGDKNPNAKKLCERYGKPHTMRGLTSTAIAYAREKGFLPPA